jgi:type IV secretory pathway TrbL component
MAKKSQHVVPDPKGGWVVKKGGSERASKHFERQQDAIDWARQLSKKQQTELVIHGRDGTIRQKDSYGRDPLPPEDHKPATVD